MTNIIKKTTIKVTVFVMTAAMVIATPISKVQAATDIPVYINGVTLTSETPAQIVDGSTLVPMRAIFEALDPTVKIEWDGQIKRIMAVWGKNTLEMFINHKTVILNGKEMEIPVAPKIIGSSTMVPLRLVGESMGAKVVWNGTEKAVYITKANIPAKPASTPAPTATPEYKKTVLKVTDKLTIYDNTNIDEIIAAGYTFEESLDLMEKACFEYINLRRVANNLRPLIWEPMLQKAARGHSMDMSKNNFFAHVGSDGNRSGSRAKAQGFTGATGENLYKGSGATPSGVYKTWFNSQGHKIAMMGDSCTEYAGIGIYGTFKDGKVTDMYVTFNVGGFNENPINHNNDYFDNMVE